jgi:antirestriction protein ArdC
VLLHVIDEGSQLRHYLPVAGIVAITDSIVAAIEAGAGNATLPWHRTGASSILPKNVATGNAYNGINVLALWATAQERAYTHSLWGTYKQFQSLDAQVRKGEKAALVIFYKQYDVEPDPQQEHDDGRRRVAKASWVFNVAQVDGYSIGEPLPPLPTLERNAQAEAFVAATGAEIRIGGESAYYRPSTDHIQMPDENLFREADSEQRTQDWYSVLTHELGHFTGHEKRLNRQFGKRFADSPYCMEELTAELCSAFLCAELGFTVQPRPDHAHYIGHWLRVMKADKRAIFTAAAAASAAARYLLSFSAKPVSL